MTFSKFFIDRPKFAFVISIVITLAGVLALMGLPVAQYESWSIPLVVATGAGSRVSLGTAVLGGMLAATVVGTLLIPVMYFAVQSIREKVKGASSAMPVES
jgi:multidrug efflux pump subunit AcrB